MRHVTLLWAQPQEGEIVLEKWDIFRSSSATYVSPMYGKPGCGIVTILTEKHQPHGLHSLRLMFFYIQLFMVSSMSLYTV